MIVVLIDLRRKGCFKNMNMIVVVMYICCCFKPTSCDRVLNLY